ncbi:MAG: hypothetical protein GEU90_00615 [Gemmatimonas sp.]|nr:hypothetical protein [Gemmatimonas sp.]
MIEYAARIGSAHAGAPKRVTPKPTTRKPRSEPAAPARTAWIDDTSDPFARSAIHESAHAVVSALRGGKIRSVRLYADESGETLCTVADPYVYVAGAIAEQIGGFGRSTGSRDDIQQAGFQLRLRFSTDRIGFETQRISDVVEQSLRQHWGAVRALATELLTSGFQLDGARVHSILRTHGVNAR